MSQGIQLAPELADILRHITIRGAGIEAAHQDGYLTYRSESSRLVVAYVRPNSVTFVLDPDYGHRAVEEGAELERENKTSVYVRFTREALAITGVSGLMFRTGLRAIAWADSDRGRAWLEDAVPTTTARSLSEEERARNAETQALEEAAKTEAALEARLGSGWRVKPLDFDDFLLAVRQEGLWQEEGAEQRDYWQRRRQALQSLLGISESHPDGQLVLAITADCIRVLGNTVNPFEGYLEAPRLVVRLHASHGARFAELSNSLEEATLALVKDAVRDAFPEALNARTSWGSLHDHGVDPVPPRIPDWD